MKKIKSDFFNEIHHSLNEKIKYEYNNISLAKFWFEVLNEVKNEVWSPINNQLQAKFNKPKNSNSPSI